MRENKVVKHDWSHARIGQQKNIYIIGHMLTLGSKKHDWSHAHIEQQSKT